MPVSPCACVPPFFPCVCLPKCMSSLVPAFLFICFPTGLSSLYMPSPVSVFPSLFFSLWLSSHVPVFPVPFFPLSSPVEVQWLGGRNLDSRSREPCLESPTYIGAVDGDCCGGVTPRQKTILVCTWMILGNKLWFFYFTIFLCACFPPFPCPSVTTFLLPSVCPQLLRSSLVNNRNQAIVCDDLGMTVYVISADTKPAKGELPSLKTKERADLVEGTSNISRLY